MAAAVLLFAAGALLVSSEAAPPDPAGFLARRGGDEAEEGHRGRHRRGGRSGESVPAVSVGDPAAKALFEAKCSLCHSLNRPLRKSRERRWWVETVTRMQQGNGCPITDEEARTIIDYLAAVRGPGSPRGPDDDEEQELERREPSPPVEHVPVPPVSSVGGGDPDATALFESKCSACHSVNRPLGKTKDRAGWTATVTRMQKVNGCEITDEEAQTIIDYLARIRGPAGK